MVEKKYLRDYPYNELGAQLFGTLREISPDELKRKRYRGVDAGHADRQGRHRGDLRPLPARRRRLHASVIVDALGTRDDTRRIDARRADPGPPAAADARPRAAARGQRRAAARDRGGAASTAPGAAGAFVAMDPRNGEVLALGSYPSFDANLFAKPIDQETYERLNSEENGAPLFNRAIAAAYPTGSTFKPITAIAALGQRHRSRRARRSTTPASSATAAASSRTPRDAVFGTLTLAAGAARSPRTSSSTSSARGSTSDGPVLQEWARKLGFGAPDRDRPARRVRRPRARPQVARRRLRASTSAAARRRKLPYQSTGRAVRVRRHRPRLERRRQRQPRRRPGRPAGHAAAAGGRLLGDRQRRQGRHAAPRPAGRGRRTAASSRRSASRPSGASTSPPARWTRSARPARRGHGRAAARRPTCSRASPIRSTARRAPPSAASNADQSWYAGYVDDPVKPIVVVDDGREGRLRRGDRRARRAADPVEVVRGQGPRRSTSGRARRDEPVPVPLRLARRVSTATPIQPASEPPPPLVPRELRLRLDPLLLLAARRPRRLLVHRDQAARRPTTSPATRSTTSSARSAYGGVGLAADVRASRGWTTRACASSSTCSTAC